MSEDNSDQSDATSTQSSETENQEENENEFEPKLTAKEYAEKWRAASAEAAKLRKDRAKINAAFEAAQKKRLEEQGEWKKIAETTRAENEALKAEKAAEKRSKAFQKELAKQGCNPDPELFKDLEKLADLEGIDLDDSSEPNQDQIIFKVKGLKEKYGAHFFKKAAPKIDDGDPTKTKGDKKLSYEEWRKLPYAEKMKRRAEVKED